MVRYQLAMMHRIKRLDLLIKTVMDLYLEKGLECSCLNLLNPLVQEVRLYWVT